MVCMKCQCVSWLTVSQDQWTKSLLTSKHRGALFLLHRPLLCVSPSIPPHTHLCLLIHTKTHPTASPAPPPIHHFYRISLHFWIENHKISVLQVTRNNLCKLCRQFEGGLTDTLYVHTVVTFLAMRPKVCLASSSILTNRGLRFKKWEPWCSDSQSVGRGPLVALEATVRGPQ